MKSKLINNYGFILNATIVFVLAGAINYLLESNIDKAKHVEYLAWMLVIAVLLQMLNLVLGSVQLYLAQVKDNSKLSSTDDDEIIGYAHVYINQVGEGYSGGQLFSTKTALPYIDIESPKVKWVVIKKSMLQDTGKQ